MRERRGHLPRLRCLALWALACESQSTAPDLDALRQPSGLAQSPDGRRLFVTGGNWDGLESAGTVMVLDLEALHAALAGPIAPAGSPTSGSQPCRRVAATDATLECDAGVFIDERHTRLLGSAVGNIVVDAPRGPDAPMRLLVTQRAPAGIAWLDVWPSEGYRVDCGDREEVECDGGHIVTRNADAPDQLLIADPSRIVLDDQGFRFAYVAHLQQGGLSLIELDGENGPELTTAVTEFFREDPFGLNQSGGFSVAARACDPLDPPVESRDCSRPLLYATHRYWPGTRVFTVAPGLELILGGSSRHVAPIGIDSVQSRPIMGSLAFEDPARGTSLLIVQTTPGALARVDTTLEEGVPRDAIVAHVPLCSNPNLLAVHRPEVGEALALVTCFGDGRLAVVSLTTFTLVESVQLGAGANEIVVDAARSQAYIANTAEHTISVVDLDIRSPRYLKEWARVGLGAGPREAR